MGWVSGGTVYSWFILYCADLLLEEKEKRQQLWLGEIMFHDWVIIFFLFHDREAESGGNK